MQKASRRVFGAIGLSCLSVALVGCLGIGIATAANGVSPDIDTFGIAETSSNEGSSESASADSLSAKASDASATATSQLVVANTRSISKATSAIDAEREAERLAAEEAQRQEDLRHTQLAQSHRDAQYASDSGLLQLGSRKSIGMCRRKSSSPSGDRASTHTCRAALSGYGTAFAEAAWENGIDPRFSPAISNTESTKGQNCFRSHNAWGWMGDTSWGSWDEAISAHAQGLAKGYGYTISLSNASKYCPPTYEDWYAKTLAQMQQI